MQVTPGTFAKITVRPDRNVAPDAVVALQLQATWSLVQGEVDASGNLHFELSPAETLVIGSCPGGRAAGKVLAAIEGGVGMVGRVEIQTREPEPNIREEQLTV